MENNRNKIIMVDDDMANLTAARNALIGKYDIFTVPSGNKLFTLLEKVTPELILLDIDMPEMDGYEIISILKERSDTMSIPVIFLTAMSDPESEIKGLDMGAVDYINKPFSQGLLLKRVELHLLLESQKIELKRYSNNLEGIVELKTETVSDLQNSILKTVAELVEYRDSITGGHIERTQNYLHLLVKLLLDNGIYLEELATWDIDRFIMSSQLHDVGKISIKDNILLKPGRLTETEFAEMKKHAIFGKEIIERIQQNTKENDFLEHAKIMAASHHEKWDGSGYPFGLKGSEIPLQGRLMALIDVYDALTNERPYKKPYAHEEVMDIIGKEMVNNFDPRLWKIFLDHGIMFKMEGSH